MFKNHMLFLVFYSSLLFSQTSKEIDSLKLIVKITKNDSVKVAVLNKIAFHYVFNDTKKALEVLKQSEEIALSKKKLFGYNETINIRAIIKDIAGESDSANYYFKKSLDYSRKHHFGTMEARSVNGLGMNNWHKGNWNLALHYFFEALKINETLPEGKKINESICFNNIGLIYQEMKLFDKAIAYHKKAYAIRIKDKLYKDQAASLNNLGICYRNKGDENTSIYYYSKSIQVAESSNNFIEYYKAKENLANVYYDLKTYSKALEMYLSCYEATKGDEVSQDNFIILGRIADCYNHLKEYKKAEKFSDEALLKIQRNSGLKAFSADLYKSLATTHYALGNIEKGEKYNVEYYNLLNETFSKANSKDFAELETKYQTSQKEKLIIKQQAEAKQKNTLVVGLSVLVLLFALIGFLLYRQQRLKISQQRQEYKLKKAISKIETQNKLQEQRLAISRDLHDNIGAQLTFIISSVDNIKYAFDITNEKLDTKLSTISGFAKDTIVELRDTIWAMNSNEISFEDLELRINNYIEKAKEAKEEISFSFAIEESLKNQNLTSIQGMNVYRTIQEAVNNAMKYANATVISIAAKRSDNRINISIQDNGVGFDIDTIEKGNGLDNMQKRIEEIGGEFSILSSKEGTIVTVFI